MAKTRTKHIPPGRGAMTRVESLMRETEARERARQEEEDFREELETARLGAELDKHPVHHPGTLRGS